eukprot:50588-Eustigmatos_ZCMA.PRE.1
MMRRPTAWWRGPPVWRWWARRATTDRGGMTRRRCRGMMTMMTRTGDSMMTSRTRITSSCTGWTPTGSTEMSH